MGGGWRRRYGVIHRPSGRGHRLYDWVNDGGEDAPPNARDNRVIALWALGLLVTAVAMAAVFSYVL